MTLAQPALVRRSRSLLVAFALVGVLISVLLQTPARASAADGTGFDPGLIISDDVFYNAGAMDEGAVQDFLNGKVASCSPSSTCLKNYTTQTLNKADDAYCNGYSGQASESAARILVRVAQSCQINPQVLLVLLEKEQGLVTSSSPSDSRYRIATGYGCPDTAPCDAEYFGFFNQVWSAARAYQRYTVNTTSQQYQPFRSNAILYHPNRACGSSEVYIQNQATANLYIYTPYQPNQSALANLYGTGDSCGSYGNRNFWRIFTDWFGSTGSYLRSGGFEAGSTAGWRPLLNSVNLTSYSTSRTGLPSKFGGWFGATNRGAAGGSIYQDIAKSSSAGQSFNGRVWLRSANPNVPFQGSLALWGLGGSRAEVSTTPFTVGGEWTLVEVRLAVQESHSSLRLEIYEGTTGTDLFVDGADLTAGASSGPADSGNGLKMPSFESAALSDWTANGVSLASINGAGTSTPAREGSLYATSTRGPSGGSLLQDVARSTSAGQTTTASVWVRSSTPGTPFDGELALWGLGGPSPEVTSTRFSAGDDWTLVTVSLAAALPHSVLRFEIYENTAGVDLHLDGAQLFANPLKNPSFEGGVTSNWSANGTTLSAIELSTDPAMDGRWMGESSTTTGAGSILQDSSVAISAGQATTATVWMRSSDPTTPFSGELTLWGLGGARAEYGATRFTVGAEWTPITATLDSSVSHSVVRLEIYQYTTAARLHVDAASVLPNGLKMPSFESAALSDWTANGVSLASINGAGTSTPAREGSLYATSTRGPSGGSLLQDVARSTSAGQTTTASVWVRSSTPGTPFDGELALWGLGGPSPEVTSTRFSAGDDWTLVTVSLAAALPHSVLRFEIYENTAGVDLHLDGAQLR